MLSLSYCSGLIERARHHMVSVLSAVLQLPLNRRSNQNMALLCDAFAWLRIGALKCSLLEQITALSR